jgi:hypothetical protein
MNSLMPEVMETINGRSRGSALANATSANNRRACFGGRRAGGAQVARLHALLAGSEDDHA